jgi:hypothetical protein
LLSDRAEVIMAAFAEAKLEPVDLIRIDCGSLVAPSAQT